MGLGSTQYDWCKRLFFLVILTESKDSISVKGNQACCKFMQFRQELFAAAHNSPAGAIEAFKFAAGAFLVCIFFACRGQGNIVRKCLHEYWRLLPVLR